jgi:putative ABC transport system permease protein
VAPFLQAWRALARRPTFTFLAVATLALGITVTTTAFSVVNRVLLRPLPFPDGDQLVAVYEASPARGQRASLIAPVRLEEWQRLNRTFTAISGSYSENVTDTSGPEPERIAGRRVMPRFFEVFGMTPLAGRTFVPSEEPFGGSGAAVIGEDYWARRFGRSPAAIGARLIVGGAGFTIVGVMPRAFGGSATDVWLPAQMSPQLLQVRQARFLVGVGRLRPGVTPAQARDDLVRVQSDLGRQYPQSDKDWSADVRDMKDVRIGDYRRPIVMLFAAVALLFAIAVANVAGLVLVQLHRRAPEFAIRAAIGASRMQIVSGVMREIAILSIAGAALGSAGAYGLTGAIAAGALKIPRIAEVALDGPALAFAIAVSVLAAVLFGGLPALAAASRRPARALASIGRGSAGGSLRRQGAIVVCQLALGVVLAGSAGLLVRSYTAMTRVDLGFSPSGVLTFHVGAAWDEDRTRVGQFQERLVEALRAMPGVRDAGFANFLPASGATLRYQVIVDGLSSDEPGGAFTVGQRTVTPGYLRALAVPLAAGQWCADPRADLDSRRIRDVMVNRTFVDRYAAGQDLVGRRLRIAQGGEFQIVGVLADVREDAASSPPFPFLYTCLPAGAWPDPEYVVRADGDPRALAAAIRSAVRSLDPTRPVFGMKTLPDVLDASLEQPRLNATALGGFAIAALVLAALGLYGLLMLLVSQRRQELGVRMALGATPRELAGVVIAGAGRLVGAGIAAGLGLSIGAGYLLRSLLFGVSPFDAAALGGSVVALAVIACVAVLVPARNASRASAMDAMRAAD